MSNDFARDDFDGLGEESADFHRRMKPGQRAVTKSKSKKSMIPKREGKDVTVARFSEEAISNPEVRNAMKDIIRLLKGLDNISGGPETTELSETAVAKSDKSKMQGHDDKGKTTPDPTNKTTDGSSLSTTTPGRPVRVSHVILKHEDPKFTKVTFERFEEPARKLPAHLHPGRTPHPTPSSTAKRDIQRLGDSARHHTADHIILNQEIPQTPTTAAADIKIPHESNIQKHVDEKVQIQNSNLKPKMGLKSFSVGQPQKFVRFEHDAPNAAVRQAKLSKAVAANANATHKTPIKPKHFAKMRDAAKRRDGHFTNKEITELMKLYKENMASDDEDKSNPNEDEKFYYYKQNSVFKEPSLSIFLPVDSTDGSGKPDGSYWSSHAPVRHETSLPENFGAPYFRLDGALLEDAHSPRMQPNLDIHKVVRTAVQEQQLIYQEATEAAKHLKKKLVKADNLYSSGPYNKSKR